MDHLAGRSRRPLIAVATALTAFCLLIITAIPSLALTVTFVRHGQSVANAADHIDTSIPGPELTELGEGQAAGVPAKLQGYGYDLTKYDRIYASTMIRTQQTAKPLSKWYKENNETPRPVTILGGEYTNPDRAGERIGVQEIGAGIFEGAPENSGLGRLGYIAVPLGWTLGARFLRIPGGENGNEFNERMTNALDQVDEESDNAVVFSHGATIMMWTLMNVNNPDLMLLLNNRLDNTDVVVVEKDAAGEWELKRWGDQEVGPANYPTKMFVNTRDLAVAPQTALYNMRQPVLALDAGAIVSTAGEGVRDVGEAGVKFVKDSVTDTVDAVRGLLPGGQSTALADTTADRPATTRTAKGLVDELKSSASDLGATLSTRTADDKDTDAPRPRLRVVADNARSDVRDAVKQTGERVKQTVDKATSDVKKVVKQARDTVRKAADAA